MICPNSKCRKENPDDNVFCEYCGTRLDATPKPDIIKKEDPVIENVNTRIWKCSVCGTENTTDMRSCIKCGNEHIIKPIEDQSNKLNQFQEKSGNAGKTLQKIIAIYLYIGIGVAIVVGIIGFPW